MTMAGILYASAVFCYAVSFFFSFRYYQSMDVSRDFIAVRWAALGLIAQSLILGLGWFQKGYPPLDTLEGILTAFSFSLATALLMGRLKTQVPVLTSLFAPFIFFIASWALIAGLKSAPLMGSHMLTIGMAGHIFLTFLGFSNFTLGFGIGAAFWIQEGRLKQHRLKKWSHRLPALEELDRLTIFFIGLGLFFWLAGLGLGAVQAFEIWNRLPMADPKILGSFLVLIIYACFFILRWGFKMSGRKSMALVMVGYVLALFTFVGVRIFMTTLHAF